MKVQVNCLMTGDIMLGTGEIVTGAYDSVRTPKGKWTVTLKNVKTGKERFCYWGKYTIVNIYDRKVEKCS